MKKLLFCLILVSAFIACGDDGAPELTITTGTSYNVNAGETFTVSGTATDDVEVTGVSMSSDGLGLSLTIPGSEFDVSPNFSVDLTPDPATPAGEYTITVTATDNENNATAEDLSVTVN